VFASDHVVTVFAANVQGRTIRTQTFRDPSTSGQVPDGLFLHP